MAFRSAKELVKKWGQAPRDGVILPVVRIGRRSQSPFFHKLGAKGDTREQNLGVLRKCRETPIWLAFSIRGLWRSYGLPAERCWRMRPRHSWLAGWRPSKSRSPSPKRIECWRKWPTASAIESCWAQGTVLDPQTARIALLAGAEFIVAPNVNLNVIRLCRHYDKLVAPGAFTATEVIRAWEAGADMVKVFPSDGVGPGYLKALKGPLPQVRLMPTGGVNLQTAADFLRAGACALGIGGSLVKPKALKDHDMGRIKALARQYIEIVKRKPAMGSPGWCKRRGDSDVYQPPTARRGCARICGPEERAEFPRILNNPG